MSSDRAFRRRQEAQLLRAQRKRQRNATTLADVTTSGMGGAVEKPDPIVSSSYTRALNVFDNIVRECAHLSRSLGGIPSPTSRHYFASLIFTLLCTRSVSLVILAPQSPWADKIIEHWDYGGMTGLLRTVMELRLTFYHLCIEEIDEVEWDLRWNLFNIHDCSSRLRLFSAMDDMQGTNTATDQESLRESKKELEGRLLANSAFHLLPAGTQKKALKGEVSHHLPLEEIAEKAKVGRDRYRFFNKLLSSHVHALPMSFYRLGDEGGRGRGLPSKVEQGYSTICLSFASVLMTSARDEMRDLFSASLLNKQACDSLVMEREQD
jgi:hypothetical protein